MNISIDCRMIACSGIGTFLQGILPFLIQDSSHTYLLIGNKSTLNKYKGDKVSILNCDIPIFSKKELFEFPVKEINKYDIYYSPNYNIPFGIRIPIVSTIHDVIFLDINGLCSSLGKFIRWGYLKYAIFRSNRIITVSQFSKNRILYHFKTKKPIIVCHNGLSEDIIKYALSRTDAVNKEKYYVFVGNIKKHKGLSVLIHAYEIAKKRGLDKKLIIVGDYDNFKTFDNEAINNSNKDVIFTGRLNNEKLYQIIEKAEALILPTLYEGFGIPPLEAMTLGTHAIISDIPVLKEIYSNYPVTFFKSEDSVDLANKLMIDYSKIHLNNELGNKYSYKLTAKKIFKAIQNTALSSKKY